MKKIAFALCAAAALGLAPSSFAASHVGAEICNPGGPSGQAAWFSYSLTGVQLDQEPLPTSSPPLHCVVPQQLQHVSTVQFRGDNKSAAAAFSCTARITDTGNNTLASGSASIPINGGAQTKTINLNTTGLPRISCSIPWRNPAGGIVSRLQWVSAQ
jgi:hypothetical protein